MAHGAEILQVQGNFDDCLEVARKLAENYPVFLVNSVNPARIEGQKTGAFEVVDTLGDAPDYHLLPVGNAGNITAYWRATASTPPLREPARGRLGRRAARGGHEDPVMWASSRGRRPDRPGPPRDRPGHDRHRHPDRQPGLGERPRRDESGGMIDSVTDEEILEAHRWLSAKEGVFVEPASAAGVAGLLKHHAAGNVPAGKSWVITVTGHGLKDPQWALRGADGADVTPRSVPFDVVTVAQALGLS
ncbi:pyridoxal-phosphate dependent enzyme [Micrococcus luteus]|uniref:pyridoxal-phosphate dependent enzyme n=1 Tax=Micrococcus luteus TaxID=1270 RepID=UPI0024B0705D|nr:pyridoxal-phosphate dependent enzyme [Micrococcus luteus]